MTVRCLPVAVVVLMVAMPAVAQEASTESSTPRDAGWRVRWDNRPELEGPGRLRVRLRARVQEEGRLRGATVESGSDSAEVERRRIGIEGTLGDVLEFELEREIGGGSPWRDAFVNYRRVRAAQVQAGQFKLPFGLEETTGRASLDFISRSLISDRLAPGRDSGLMLHGRVARKTIGYEVGLFAHDGDNARPNGGRRVFGGRTLAGRLTVEPFHRSKSTLWDVRLGAAFTHSALPEGFPAIRGRSVLGVKFFPSDLWVKGSRQRAGLQARWRPGRFSVASEFIRVRDERREQSLESTDLPPFLSQGWYVSGTWVVAGARRASTVAVPGRPLFRGGFGSVQVALRLERLSLGNIQRTAAQSTSPRAGSVPGNRDTATTLGMTWHPNRWVAIQGNLVREAMGIAAGDSFPRGRVWGRLIQLQLAV